MGLLVELILENDNTKTNVSSRDGEGDHSDDGQSQLPSISEGDETSSDESGGGLHNRSLGDTSESDDLLCVVRERRGEHSGGVAVLIEEGDVLAESGAE